jgi:tRNA modification GTPase
VLAGLAPRLKSALKPRRPRLATLDDASGERIDRGLVTFFEAPNSYTGEDVVEISIPRKPRRRFPLIEAAIAAGARGARPGEFTERAFRAGKLDLVRAEAVRDLIEAQTPAAARFSCPADGRGPLEKLSAAREDLLAAAAGIAAAIDFSDDVGESVDAEVERRLRAAADALAAAFGHVQDRQASLERLPRGHSGQTQRREIHALQRPRRIRPARS